MLQRETLLEEIALKIGEMAFLFNKVKVTLKIPPNVRNVPIESVRDAHRWLNDLRNHEYAEALDIRGLCSEEIWSRMEARNETDFIEYRKMVAAFKKLRNKVYDPKRPIFFRKDALKNALREIKQKQQGTAVEDSGKSESSSDSAN